MALKARLTNEQESHVRSIEARLARLATVKNDIPPATYRACVRDALRDLVVRTIGELSHTLEKPASYRERNTKVERLVKAMNNLGERDALDMG